MTLAWADAANAERECGSDAKAHQGQQMTRFDDWNSGTGGSR